MALIFEFTTQCPKWKNQVISLNNVGKWLRFQGSKIKNEYKEMLKEWHIPTPDFEHSSLYIEFHLTRHNGRVLDSDGLGFIIKYTIDAIKETANDDGLRWMTDDDQITYLVKPAVLDRDLLETEITVKVFDKYEPFMAQDKHEQQ